MNAALWSIALLLAAGMALHTYEHARFGRSRLRTPCAKSFQPRVEVVLPCKNVDAEFDALVTALLAQDYPDYGVTFAVEAEDDPAWERARSLLPKTSRVATRIIIAGEAEGRGQKVHNLLAATASLPENAAAIAFLDSDIRIEADWLSRLIEPLHREGIGAVTGYRWFIPAPGNWPGTVLSALNAPVALLLGNHGWNVIWGGSWSVLRSTFETAGIRDAWEHALTEDLPAWRAVKAAGLRVLYEPNCLAASPASPSWGELFEFARRQYLILRIYAPGLWLLAFAGAALFNAAFWIGVFRGAWSSVAALYFLAATRAGLRQSFAAVRFPAPRAALLDIFAGPLLAALNLILIFSSAFGRRLTWRGIVYQLDGPRQTRVVSRRAQSWWRKKFDELEEQRAERIAIWLHPHLQAGETLLDFGCGSQIVAHALQQRSAVRVTGLDTLDFGKRNLPFVLYDGVRAPFDDRSFDTVLLCFVLHHCADGGMAVLREAQRIARNKILLLEDSYENPAERFSMRLIDKVLNWLEDPRIPVPCRFRTAEEWRRVFGALGLELTAAEGARTTPLLHTRQRLFVLRPRS